MKAPLPLLLPLSSASPESPPPIRRPRELDIWRLEDEDDYIWVKNPKGKAKVWQYFEINVSRTKVRCKKCFRTYFYSQKHGTTSNLNLHLKRDHDIIF